MTETNDGGPAFPCGEDYEIHDRGGRSRHTKGPLHHGATLRDFFAAAALTGLAAQAQGNPRMYGGLGKQYPNIEEVVAHVAYLYADAMLAERERAGGGG